KETSVDYRFNSNVMICGGPRDEQDGLPCRGDSGGPLLCQNKNGDGSWVVYGVVSYGRSVACLVNTLLPSAFTRVSYFLPWINSRLNQETIQTFNSPSEEDNSVYEADDVSIFLHKAGLNPKVMSSDEQSEGDSALPGRDIEISEQDSKPGV